MQSYQLHINLEDSAEIEIGKLGKFTFPIGNYIYTGSAKKNIDKRIKRHQSNLADKKIHWHVDYLLNNENAKIIEVQKFDEEECILNQKTCGKIIVTGFGSSDCKSGCKSHLKYLG